MPKIKPESNQIKHLRNLVSNSGGLHVDAAPRHRHAVRGGLATHVDHVGLARGVEVRQGCVSGVSGGWHFYFDSTGQGRRDVVNERVVR